MCAGLAENRCLVRRPNGAQLLQIGEQEIALGAKFRARLVLEVEVRAPWLSEEAPITQVDEL